MAGGHSRTRAKIFQNAIKCPEHDRLLGRICEDGIELWCKERHAVVLTWHQMEELLGRGRHGKASAD